MQRIKTIKLKGVQPFWRFFLHPLSTFGKTRYKKSGPFWRVVRTGGSVDGSFSRVNRTGISVKGTFY